MSPEVCERIRDELERLEEERAEFAALLIELQDRDPDGIELRALAGMLHSLYAGIEGIIKHFLMDLDGIIPSSAGWHAELLTQATKGTEKRLPLLDDELYGLLRELMAFRHRYRNTYGFEHDWEKMRDLTFSVFGTMSLFEESIKVFMTDCPDPA